MAADRLLLVGLLLPGAARAGCDAAVPAEALDGLLASAEQALAGGERGPFVEASDAVRAALPCLGTVPAPEQVARIHRLEGLRRVDAGAEDADRAFAAARALDPNQELPLSLAPERGPARAAWQAFDLAVGGLETLEAPTEGLLRVDGIDTLERPSAWPALVQWVDLQERPRWSAYQWPGEALPAYPVAAPVAPPAPAVTRAPKHRLPLAIATGAAAAITATSWGVAASSRAAFFDLDTPDERLDPLKSRANTFGAATVGTGVATVGLGAALALTW